MPIGDVGRYEAITRGVQVLESPTVLVIGAGGKARAITGYTQPKEIDQAVSDIGGNGFEASKAFQHKGFAAVADDACKDFGYALEQKSNPPTTVAALSKALGTGAVELGHSRNRLAKAKATSADERKLKSALVAFADQDIKWVAEARSQLKAGAEPGHRLPHARAARERRQQRLRRRRQEAARPRLLRLGLIDPAPGLHWPGARRALRGAPAATRSAAAASPSMTARPAAPRAAISCASASPSTATAWPTPASRRRAAARPSPRAAPPSSSCAGRASSTPRASARTRSPTRWAV